MPHQVSLWLAVAPCLFVTGIYVNPCITNSGGEVNNYVPSAGVNIILNIINGNLSSHGGTAQQPTDGSTAATFSRYTLHDTLVNWVGAAELCASKGLQLATFNNQEEFDILVNLIKGKEHKKQYWIGGSDQSQEGTFKWLATGMPFTYTRWSSGQPDNVNLENCAEIRPDFNYLMNDHICTIPKYAACEIRLR